MTTTEPSAVTAGLPALAGVTHHQVLQRQDLTGCGLAVPADSGVEYQARGGHGLVASTAADGVLWLPTGGPYDLVAVDADGTSTVLAVDVLVGDLWVLAGQSNMEGCGLLSGAEPALATVRAFDMAGQWRPAHEPLHMKWLSRHPVHARLEAEREIENAGKDPDRDALVFHQDQVDEDEQSVNGFLLGVGPGVGFANEVGRRTGVPVGLIPASHGGSSMAQWSPASDDGLFDAMLSSVDAAGGRITGVLWYQGESESDTSRPYTYDEELAALLAAMRERTGNPALKVLMVQLGRFTDRRPSREMELLWSRLRESQRTCPEADAVTTAVDLELDDPIHIGGAGQVQLGRRLGRLAAGGPAVTVADVTVGRDGLIVDVRFEGVVGALSAQGGLPRGFSIRNEDGDDLGLIFKADLAVDSVRLRLARRLRAGEQLWYGFGLDPYCNVMDSEGMALPAFGPVPLAVA